MATSSTKYVRKTVIIEASRNSDYSSPINGADGSKYVEEYKPHEFEKREVLAVTSAGTTIDLGMYTTIEDIVIYNHDDTNFVTATFRTNANGANNNIVEVEFGRSVNLGRRVTVANDLVLIADTADCECTVEIYGTT